MYISCGILFNHEGEKRGYEFVTRKITQALAQIYLGLNSELTLGHIEASRDWGYAGDYVEAMYLMLQQDSPDDFVISTGETHTVREFLETAFDLLEITDGVERYVKYDKKFERPTEVDLLVGDNSKAVKLLGWTPKVNFRELVKLMLINDLEVEASRSGKNCDEIVNKLRATN
jgi:GDPmannose 4,6-dehydratase